MKLAKTLRILGIAVIMSLLVTLTIGTPALGARSIEFYNDEDDEVDGGAIGETITIMGTGFNPSTEDSERHVDIYFSADAGDTSDYMDTQIDTYEFLRTPLIGEEDDESPGFRLTPLQIVLIAVAVIFIVAIIIILLLVFLNS